jgi:hypothetical protein
MRDEENREEKGFKRATYERSVNEECLSQGNPFWWKHHRMMRLNYSVKKKI